MSVLQCSNIHFESTGNNRLQYTGSNSFVLVAAGSNAATITTTGVSFTNTNLTLANVTSTTNTFTVGTAAYFVANGNLGIGNSTPSDKLSVNGTLRISSAFYVGSNASIVASGRTLNLGDGDETVSADAGAGGYSYLVRESTGTIQLSARGGGAVSNIRLVGNTIGIGPYPTASLYTVANGNVGVGTASPGYKLDISGSSGYVVNRVNATDGSLTRVLLQNANRAWSISNYGASVSPAGCFAIADESSGSVRFMIDSQNGNISLNGGTPYPWGPFYQSGIDYGYSGYGSISCRADFNVIGQNIYMNSSGNWVYKIPNQYAYWYYTSGGYHVWGTAANNAAAGSNASIVSYMSIDPAGRVTIPYQPVFRASSPTNTTYSNGALITCTATGINIGNHYNTSTGRFTAPVAGSYQFHINVYVWSNSGTTTQSYALRVNNAELSTGDTMIFYCGAITGGDNQKSGSVILYLNAGDYVTLHIRSGMPAVNIYGGHTFWSGHLIG